MRTTPTELTVASGETGLRLDRLLTRHLTGMTRASIRALLDAGRVLINDRAGTAPAQKLAEGDLVRIVAGDSLGDPRPYLLFEDRFLIVAFRPAGAGLPPTLLAGAKSGRGRRPAAPRAALALGRPLSGIIPLVRGSQPLSRLREQFDTGRAVCRMLALVDGTLPGRSGELPGGWSWTRRERFEEGLLLSLTAPPTSKPRPLAALAAAGLRVRALTEHGRTRLALHLGSIAFGHPVTGRLLRFEVPPPPSLKAALASCHGVRALTAPAVVAHPVPEHPERVLRSPRLVLQTRAMRRPA